MCKKKKKKNCVKKIHKQKIVNRKCTIGFSGSIKQNTHIFKNDSVAVACKKKIKKYKEKKRWGLFGF